MTEKNYQEIINMTTNGVYVIGSKNKGIINGMTCAWLTQISFEPMLIAVSIDKSHYTSELIKKSGVFSVSILSESQKDIAKHFGFQSGKNVNKFNNIKYEISSNGVPILKDCIAYLDCKVVNFFDIANRILFIGEVLSAGLKQKESRPLIYRYYDYF
ncbi:MAG: flavin reductase family protein [Caldisphaera sp.]|uniref:flavin reductase family protein n=1 Tax=Caldisphaera sp. TaxID=2060322 RepID=UPI003D0A2936